MGITKIVWYFVTVSLCTSVLSADHNQLLSEQETGNLNFDLLNRICLIYRYNISHVILYVSMFYHYYFLCKKKHKRELIAYSCRRC